MASGCAVTPSVPFQHSTFEGFPVISYVPEHPRGMVYVFHGSNGSANFAERLETVDVLNLLISKGYGFVSTSSTERTGDKRWNVFDASVQTNPDLARLARLQTSLVANTPLEANTPLVGIGMSNGARFVTLWGQAWKNAGYPVKAIWASHGNAAPSVEGAGKLTVPTVFSTAVNDFTVPPGQVIADYTTAHNAGTPERAVRLAGAQPQLPTSTSASPASTTARPRGSSRRSRPPVYGTRRASGSFPTWSRPPPARPPPTCRHRWPRRPARSRTRPRSCSRSTSSPPSSPAR